MSTQNVRLPNVYIDAKELLNDTLNENRKVSIKTYGVMYSQVGDVMHHSIGEVTNEESYANLDLMLTYVTRQLTFNNDAYAPIEKTRNLRVLNTLGDTRWTYNMIVKVWEGEYPSTVAVDMDSGNVFLVGVKANRIELTDFGILESSAFDAFHNDLNDREPFKIKIDEEAMFDVLDGSEGTNHLRHNVFIEFDCGMPIRVYSHQKQND
jgi:hypothetical protein